ncbi:sugar ABC transporter substrate-binding protein (plasmid) [Phyllobacterium sp. 628]|uniref:ABC transporter substrate-binding protein n=1 Tax=Phyllobacterium sp. 628 TaxID=2718938 RepID=UPI0016622328|nr:substrate-binding domain-containing protein [Phyllobacterium sp. 628]QND55034.1 sugar ABC transporter substrate-binding protein [Phyllobacterium sp. 628]
MTLNTTRRMMIALAGFTALSCVVSSAVAQEKKTIALVQINQQALFFNQMNQGAQKAADAAGVKLVIFNSNNEPTAQNSAIETYIQEKVSGLAVVAIDVNGLMPAVKQAADAGIPVVAIDAILPEGPQKAQIGVDNAKAGADMGKFFLDFVKANMGGKAKIGVVGALNSYIQNVRQEGFEKTIKGTDGIVIAGVVDGQNVQDNALSAAENLITGNPDLTAIYATGEPALMGAIAAVQSQGKQDTIKVFGWDLTAEAIAGIDAGFVAAVVQQDPSAMGAAAVNALQKVSAGQAVEKNIAVPITIVTKANVDPYRAVFK